MTNQYNPTETIQIDRFDLSNLVDYSNILICGKHGCGKTETIKQIVEHYKNIKDKIIISQSEETDPDVCEKYPDVKQYFKYNNAVMGNIMALQKIKNGVADFDLDNFVKPQTPLGEKPKNTIPHNASEKSNDDVSLLLILDDCLMVGNMDYDVLTDLMTNVNENRMIIVIATQYITSYMWKNINLFNHIFLSADNVTFTQMRTYRNLIQPIIGSFEQFKYIFNRTTKDYNQLVISRSDQPNISQLKYYNARSADVQPIKTDIGNMDQTQQLSDSTAQDQQDDDPIAINEMVFADMCRLPNICIYAKYSEDSSAIVDRINKHYPNIPHVPIKWNEHKNNNSDPLILSASRECYETNDQLLRTIFERQQMFAKQLFLSDHDDQIVVHHDQYSYTNDPHKSKMTESIMCGRSKKLINVFVNPTVPPFIRSNFDYIFMCPKLNENVLKKIYEQYSHLIPYDYDDFRTIYENMGDDSLVLNSTKVDVDGCGEILYYNAHITPFGLTLSNRIVESDLCSVCCNDDHTSDSDSNSDSNSDSDSDSESQSQSQSQSQSTDSDETYDTIDRILGTGKRNGLSATEIDAINIRRLINSPQPQNDTDSIDINSVRKSPVNIFARNKTYTNAQEKDDDIVVRISTKNKELKNVRVTVDFNTNQF